jgi:hypothetical protein
MSRKTRLTAEQILESLEFALDDSLSSNETDEIEERYETEEEEADEPTDEEDESYELVDENQNFEAELINELNRVQKISSSKTVEMLNADSLQIQVLKQQLLFKRMILKHLRYSFGE